MITGSFLAMIALVTRGSAAVLFNVGFDSSSEVAVLTDGGGGFPAPSGIPTVSNLVVNAPNTSHVGSAPGETLWIDGYSSGDSFSFRLNAQPGQRIRMTGVWYEIATNSPAGPDSVSVDFISLGGSVSQQVASGTSGLEFFDVLSDSSDVEIRLSGFGGAGDLGSGPNESFGVNFISAGFEVIPEPSVSSLLALLVVGGFGRRFRG